MTRNLMGALILVASFGTVVHAQDAADVPAVDPADGAIQLRPSLQWGIVKGDRTSGFGLGLDLIIFPNEGRWHYGAFAETQGELDGAWRTSGGFTAGYGIFGLQLGLMHRTEGDFAATTAVHIAKTVTLGPVGLSWRIGIPIADHQSGQGEPMSTRGFEAAFTLSVGWSFGLRGERPPWSCHHHGDAEADEAPQPDGY